MRIAIIGATGMVGREILKIIENKGINKNNELFLYASSKSSGKEICVGEKLYKVSELDKKKLKNKYDFAIFSAGKLISLQWAGEFTKRGAFVIDNSSAFRRDKDKALVVPEINFNSIKKSKIIANPNCSTIGLSLPVFEIGKIYKIKRVIVSTYQAVSGAGKGGVDDLENKTCSKLPYVIDNNLIPQIDFAMDNGYTFEEDKMEFELKKILNNNRLKVSATCVRVPILNCHSESVYIEFYASPNLNKIKTVLKNTKGIKLVNETKRGMYPMPLIANGKDDIYLGRLRKDSSNSKAISFFITFDNIRKGAALNAVQIMEGIMANKNI